MTQWVKEQQEKKNYPAIKPIGVDIASYDFIVIGTPSWYNTLATPIVTLLRQTDFRGKPVAIFGTHQGNGSKILGDFAALVKNARIVRGELFANIARDNQIEAKVAGWVRGLRM
jgi:flavodoxin